MEGKLLCADCADGLLVAPPRCYRCRRLSIKGRTCEACRRTSRLYAVQAATVYGGIGKDLVGRLKFSGARAAALTVAGAMSGLDLPATCVIVPVPTATSRVRLRGYDQSVLIAKALARQTNREYVPCLRRIGQQRQVGASRTQRLQQMEQSFLVWDTSPLQGRQVVLVDDVMTTGSTLESAAAIVKAAGAKRVEAMVFARA